ncbi:MAG: hypothetical protein WA317_11925 [Mycobacterium sp.]|uniref:hypothetical protein n=1 Tax=Mycobacterium sp. TaxID=1785 RepID=UPI003CC61981
MPVSPVITAARQAALFEPIDRFFAALRPRHHLARKYPATTTAQDTRLSGGETTPG